MLEGRVTNQASHVNRLSVFPINHDKLQREMYCFFYICHYNAIINHQLETDKSCRYREMTYANLMC